MTSILAAIILAASPTFVTPEMTYRRGLTDAQYEYLWKMGRNPSIDRNTMRDWYFKSHRYVNVTNWLNIVGQTNNYAALSYTLQDENFSLIETNSILVATNTALSSACVRLSSEVYKQWSNYTNQLAETTAFSNAYVIASGVAASATAKIQDEIADLEAKIEKYKEYQTKYPILKSIFAAMITDAQNRINILKSLTGGL